MKTPIVIEIPPRLEPGGHDPFLSALGGSQARQCTRAVEAPVGDVRRSWPSGAPACESTGPADSPVRPAAGDPARP